MKLTNISLAILVAVGVAACGGSDDNNSNKPNDNKPTPTPTPTPTPDNSNKPVDPERKAPDMAVQPQLQDLVTAAKVSYAQSGMRDLLTGYAPNAGIVGSPRVVNATYGISNIDPVTSAAYKTDPVENAGFRFAKHATDGKDLKRLAETKDGHQNAINYVATGQLRTNAAVPERNGAVLANPGFTYAKGKDGLYYRMQPENNGKWDETTPNTKYVPVGTAGSASGGVGETVPATQFEGGKVGQDKLVFLPNVTKTTNADLVVKNSGSLGINGQPGGVDRINPEDLTKFSGSNAAAIAGGSAPANLVGGQAKAYTTGGNTVQAFTVDWGDVTFVSAEFNGKTYDLTTIGQNQRLELQNLPKDKSSIQYLPVKLNYQVKDSKGTVNLVDDHTSILTANAGAMKAYNLPYSLAFVTVNQKGAEKARMTQGAAARNLFDLPTTAKNGDLGAFQVQGYKSPYLPRNGRADYNGKSFGVDSQGDVHLRADFGATGAHIGGAVVNRTYANGQGTLPDIDLSPIQLSAPGSTLNTTGTKLFLANGAEAGSARGMGHTGTWDVQLFGPDANEAGGVISIQGNDAVIPGGLEVFTSQRGEITKDSNIAPTP